MVVPSSPVESNKRAVMYDNPHIQRSLEVLANPFSLLEGTLIKIDLLVRWPETDCEENESKLSVP